MSSLRNITTPVGRLVGGSVFKYRDKDFDGRPMMTRDNKPRVEYVLLVAFSKEDPEVNAMYQAIAEVAQESFPALFVNGQAPAGFSFKMTDGDSTIPNAKGGIPREKEGYPGHWVFKFSTSFAPKAYGAQLESLVDETAIKRGYWVRIGATCKGNGSTSKPGVYLNHSMVQLVGYGEEISTGPDVATVFAAPAALPAGVSATPVAPVGAMPGMPPVAAPGGVPGMPAGVPVAAAQVAPAPVAQAMPPMPAAPAAAVPPGAAAPAVAPIPGTPAAAAPMPGMPAAPAMPGMPAVAAPMPGMPAVAAPIAPAPVAVPGMPATAAPQPGFGAAPVAPAAKQMVPGCPHTYEALVASGWNEDQMRAAGHLA